MNSRPSKELREALENLEAFTAVSEEPSLVPAECLEVQAGKIVPVQPTTLKKTVDLACAFLATAFPAFAFEGQQDDLYHAIVRSSEIVKKNATLLRMWEVGTDEQRRFASYAKAAIGKFNMFVERAQETPSSTAHLFRFFYGRRGEVGKRLSKIDVHPQATNICISSLSSTQYDPLKLAAKFAAKAAGIVPQKVARLRESFLPVQARELFIMKAISLLEKNGIASHEEARLMVRSGTICTSCDPQDGIHTLSLLLQPCPGRVDRKSVV